MPITSTHAAPAPTVVLSVLRPRPFPTLASSLGMWIDWRVRWLTILERFLVNTCRTPKTGRIFMGGTDGYLYELKYQVRLCFRFLCTLRARYKVVLWSMAVQPAASAHRHAVPLWSVALQPTSSAHTHFCSHG